MGIGRAPRRRSLGSRFRGNDNDEQRLPLPIVIGVTTSLIRGA
jgi:hypothetical protein